MKWFPRLAAAALALSASAALGRAADGTALNVDRKIPTKTVRLSLTADRIQKITPADPKTVPASQFIVIHRPRVVLSEKFVFIDDVEVVSLPFAAVADVRRHVCHAYGFGEDYSVVGYDLNSSAKGFRLAMLEKTPGRVHAFTRDNDWIIQQVTCLPSASSR